MDTLMDSTAGVYRVATAASTYEIDLDRMVLRRDPRTEDTDGALLRRDDELITLVAVIECTVGHPMELLIDLHVVGVEFTTRHSTPVLTIVPIHYPGYEAHR